MKTRILTACLALIFTPGIGAQTSDKHYGENEDYRRSSLCLIMLTHQDTKYAQEMEEQFLQIPLPVKYNAHNTAERILSSSHQELKKDEVIAIVEERQIAKELVLKWLNYDPVTGNMNLDLVHRRGDQNATYADLQRALSTARGVEALGDEGLELIQNTFLLVCDMSYYDRSKTGGLLTGLGLIAAGVMQGMANEERRKGNRKQADSWDLGTSAALTGAVVASDLGGFSVRIYAHLLRLKWNDDLTDKMFSEYWVDEDTPDDERRARRLALEQDNESFGWEYVGTYTEKTGKTVFKSANDMLAVIRQVCADTIDEGMETLAKKFPVFRPKTTFLCGNNLIYAYIGLKEGVNSDSKYEILEKKKKNGEIVYKAIDEARPQEIWDNSQVIMEEVDLSQVTGSSFKCKKGKDVCDKGYLMREKM